MSGRSFIARLFLYSTFLLVFSGCSQMQTVLKPPEGISESEEISEKESFNINEVRSEDYPEEISRHLDIVDNSQERDARVDAQLQLARLYSSVVNPERNNKKAIEHLEKYIASVPEANVQYKAKDWLATLKDIERLTKKTKLLNVRVRDLKRENKALDDTIEKLKQDNQDLNDKIEKLKTLEIMHEKKKKKYR